MLHKLNINKMTLLWIAVVIVGALMTIYGSHRLSVEWTKKDVLRQAHTTPETFLFDCEVEAELEEDLKNTILKNCLSKISGQGKMNDLTLSPFFDQTGYEKNKIAERDYSLDNEIYKNFTTFDILGLAVSKDSALILDLRKDEHIVKLSADKENKESHIEVREYDGKTGKFKIYYRNINLGVSSKTLSTFVTDLNNGKFTLNIVTNKKVKITKISDVYLKTKMLKYFKIDNIKEDHIGQNIGEIKLLLY